MKTNIFSTLLIFTFLFISCGSKSNSPEFLEQFSGNYLYSDDELVKVHSKDGKLLMDWRGAENIEPLKTDENTFFVKEMNAKVQFLVNPDDNKEYLVFVPKDKNEKPAFEHPKVANNYKTPSNYLTEGNYEKALEGFLNLKKKDSLGLLINTRKFDQLGSDYLRQDSIKKAIDVFKINTILNPDNTRAFRKLGNAYLKNSDTANAILNYEKSLAIDSGNRPARESLERLQNKKEETTN